MRQYQPDYAEVKGDALYLTFGIESFSVPLGEIEGRLNASSMAQEDVVLAIAKELFRAGKGVGDVVAVINESGVIL